MIDKRNIRRLKCSMEVLACTTLDTRPAQIVNLSDLGAKIRMDDPFAVGTRIHLDVDGDFYWGSVVWTDADRLGVRFHARVSTGVLRARMTQLRAAPESPARVGAGFGRRSAPPSPWG